PFGFQSANGEYMAYPRPLPHSPLLNLLVARDRTLAPQRPQSSFVSTPQNLPARGPRYGPSPPGFVQSSRYTGGVTQNPYRSAPVEPPPNFQAPIYAGVGGLPPVARPVAPVPLAAPSGYAGLAGAPGYAGVAGSSVGGFASAPPSALP